jgi:hypothetical protein
MGEAGQALNRYPGGGDIRKRKRKSVFDRVFERTQNGAKFAVCCSWTSSKLILTYSEKLLDVLYYLY